MQTFLPEASFFLTVGYLDMRRLGKQRVEAFQLLCALGDEWALEERNRRNPTCEILGDGWKNHPAARMWAGCEYALGIYMNFCIEEWEDRGYKNTMAQYPGTFGIHGLHIKWPSWLGDEEFHLSHKSNLVRKDPKHYRRFWPDVPDDLPYVWPVPA
jgi:hypothetical protein